jgi:hypothetical protein
MAAIFHFFFMPMLKIHPLPIKKYFYLHMSKNLCNHNFTVYRSKKYGRWLTEFGRFFDEILTFIDIHWRKKSVFLGLLFLCLLLHCQFENGSLSQWENRIPRLAVLCIKKSSFFGTCLRELPCTNFPQKSHIFGTCLRELPCTRKCSLVGMEKAVDFCFRKGRSSGERHSNQTWPPPKRFIN